MADNKFQVIKKSLSSWSLSTIKKPTISVPKFRKPKIKLFSNKKKVKPEEEKKSNSKEVGENDSLISDESTSRTVIHDPRYKDGCNDHPYIILTVHNGEVSQDEKSNDQAESDEDVRDYAEGSLEKQDKDLSNPSDICDRSNEIADSSKVESKFIGNAIKFIDDDDEVNNDRKDHHHPDADNYKSNLGISLDEYYSWFDAEGPTLQSLDKEKHNINNEEYANYMASEYYDASESRTLTPSGRSYEDIEFPEANDSKLPGSAKARDWVKSFDEKNIDQEINKAENGHEEEPLPRSRSELQLNTIDEKRTKNEIILNTNENGSISSMKHLFSKFLPKINKNQNNATTHDSSERITKECEELERRESMKKIFGVRGKVSLKTTVIDSNFFKDSDRHMASKPFALTNTVKSSVGEHAVSKDSLDTLDSNLRDSLDHTNSDSTSTREQIADETEELMKEIEKYLLDTDYIGQPKPIKNDVQNKNNLQSNFVSDGTVNTITTTDVSSDEHPQNEREEMISEQIKDNVLLNSNAKEGIIHDGNNVEQHDSCNINKCEIPCSHIPVNEDLDMNVSKEEIEHDQHTDNQSEIAHTESTSEENQDNQSSSENQQNSMCEIEAPDEQKVINEDKVKKAGMNFTNSLKTLKDNIFSSENKDLSKLKDEWKKKKSKLYPFRQKTKLKNNEYMSKTDQENTANLEAGSINHVPDDSNSNADLSIQFCSFTEKNDKDKREDEDQNKINNIIITNNDINVGMTDVHEAQIHSNFNDERDEYFTKNNKDKVPVKEDSEPDSSLIKNEINLVSRKEESPTDSSNFVDVNYQNDKCFSQSMTNDHGSDIQSYIGRTDIHTSEDIKEYNYANFIAKSLIKETDIETKGNNKCNPMLNTDSERTVENSEIRKPSIIEEDSTVYENEILEEDLSSESKEPPILHPRPVTKNLDLNINTETSLIVKPKPKPRTRKGKYDYAKVRNSSHLDHLSSVNEEQNTTVHSMPEIFIETERDSNHLQNGSLNEIKISSRNALNDSKNDAEFSNSFTDDSSLINEPIYWEIGDSLTVPVASPRKRKDKNQKCSPASSSGDIKGSSDVPEWIQQRPPIPSPRNKKPKSTQSSIQDLQTESQDDVHILKNGNVFGSSYTNFNFEEPKERNETKWSGEDFYSGKAASISYGITFRSTDSPPVLPQRSKKSSLTSLPASIPNDEPSPFVRYIKPPSELNKKRIRRKTSPAIPPRGTPRQMQTHLNPLQALEENLRYFMQIVTSASEPKASLSKAEELLSDILYSVNSIMGQDVSNTWVVTAPGVNIQNNKGVNVTLGQVRAHLQESFQVSPEQFEEILQEVLKREAANVTLTLKIVEASDLRAKTVKGGSNPFVTAAVPGSNQSHRTRTEHETLSPKWQQEFKMKIKNLNKDILKLEVWHDLDGNVVNQVSAVKDLKSLQRLVKGTTALAQKQDTHLLGSVQILIKDIRENGMNSWFPLFKDSPKEEGKERGQLHIEAFVTAAKQGISLSDARKNHDALLAKLIYHHIKTVSNNNTEEGTFQMPWHGQLSPEANAAIAQHAIILGLPPALQNLSWWIVGSRVPSSDAGWQLKYLKIIQSHMSTDLFDKNDLESIANSFSDWTESSLLKLRNLKRNFPPTSGILAKHQLSSLLAIFIALDAHRESSYLLEGKEIRDLKSQVREAVTDYTKVWWTRLIEEQLKGETIPEHQIQKIVIITSEVHNFLGEIATFYSPSLLKEMSIPYFREMYILITKKLNPCVRPPLINVYNHLENVSELTFPDEDEKKISTLTLEDGTNLWQLYMNMGRLYKLGIDLPTEIRKESGIHEYHKWFNKAVKRWVELARTKAELMIEKAVKLDDFEPIDEYNNFSSSATDVSGIFTDVQIWWQKLEWPDPENSMILLARILEDICSYGMKYADLLKQKVEVMFSVQTNSDQLVISKQICTGLNNIERIRDELTRLPEKFLVRLLIENVKRSQTGGEKASERFRSNIDTLVEISSENMETKVTEFIEAVMEKMTGTLHHAVIQACETSSEKSLFTEVLDPALQLLHRNMSDNNFRRFLQRLWEVLIELFHMNVTRNTDKRKASYFNGIYNILNACTKFFSPCEGVGLTTEGAHTQEYVHLMELLECLRLSSENLISKYYNERYEEQKLLNVQSKGELVVRVYFTKAGKLVIEVIMAKDMELNNEVGSLTSKTSQFLSQNQQIDSYVKVQIMPLEWFPSIHEVKTKTLRNSDPAVFEESFEFELKNDDNGVSSGFVLFTVKDYHLGRSNKFIGESVIPLQDLQCIDSSSVHTVPNIYIKITQPGMECGYASLRALRLRTGDKVATGFLKKIQPRLSDARQRAGCATASSDEERPRARSPRLLQKFGLS